MQAEDPKTKWWIASGDQKEGPFSTDEVREKVESSHYGADDLICAEGNDDWISVTEWASRILDRPESSEEGDYPHPLVALINAQKETDEVRLDSEKSINTNSESADQTTASEADSVVEGALIVEASNDNPQNIPDRNGSQDKAEEEESEIAGWLGSLAAVIFFTIWFFGWNDFLWGVGWIAVVLLGLGSFVLGSMALDNVEKGEQGYDAFIPALICGILALGIYNWIQPSSSSDPAKLATLNYWNAIPKCLDSGGHRIQNRKEMMEYFNRYATRIEQLPTENVDPLAVEWGLEAARSLRSIVRLCQAYSVQEQQLFVRSFVNGYTGNFMGGLADISSTLAENDARSNDVFNNLSYVWNQRSSQVRSKLTEKYDVQFSSISW